MVAGSPDRFRSTASSTRSAHAVRALARRRADRRAGRRQDDARPAGAPRRRSGDSAAAAPRGRSRDRCADRVRARLDDRPRDRLADAVRQPIQREHAAARRDRRHSHGAAAARPAALVRSRRSCSTSFTSAAFTPIWPSRSRSRRGALGDDLRLVVMSATLDAELVSRVSRRLSGRRRAGACSIRSRSATRPTSRLATRSPTSCRERRETCCASCLARSKSGARIADIESRIGGAAELDAAARLAPWR